MGDRVPMLFSAFSGLSNQDMAKNKQVYATIANMAKEVLQLRKNVGFCDNDIVVKNVWLTQYKKLRFTNKGLIEVGN